MHSLPAIYIPNLFEIGEREPEETNALISTTVGGPLDAEPFTDGPPIIGPVVVTSDCAIHLHPLSRCSVIKKPLLRANGQITMLVAIAPLG